MEATMDNLLLKALVDISGAELVFPTAGVTAHL